MSMVLINSSKGYYDDNNVIDDNLIKYLMYTCYAISFITSLPFLIFLSRLFVDTFKKAILFI